MGGIAMINLYDNLFKASFLTYIIYLLKEINTRQRGDDHRVFIGIIVIGLLYQLCYVVFFRKRNGVTLGRAIARYFLYTLSTFSLTSLFHGFDLYFFGYDVYSWILPEYIKTVYGMDALRQSWFFIFIPLWIVNGLYVVSYRFISNKIKNKAID